MEDRKEYSVYGSKNYYIVEKEGKKYFQIGDLLLELCPSGYVPKSGLLYDKVLTNDICEGKKVLDIGCGYLGIIGMIAKLKGAREVNSTDYDDECITWLNKITKDNKITNLRCWKSDWFKDVQDKDYNIILTNPPIMPMKEGSLHDSGGLDGRKDLINILNNAKDYLDKDGLLYMLAFDFLGTNQRTNNEPSLFEIAGNLGYKDMEVVLEAVKRIKENSVTYDNLDYIKSIYPNYQFEKENETNCKIQILKLKK